jgi:2,4-dichlorophenol 6-monooxygenase
VKKADLRVPVLIVGGGGAGLTSSILLSRLGIDSLLISRYAETSQMPKAHILNQRTMEIFSDAGVAPRILARGTPPENMRGVGWYIGATSSDPAQQDGCGRRLAFAEGWGGGYTDPDYIAASPCAAANLPLIRLEPILKEYAAESPQATVRFHHELVGMEQDADGVTASVLNRDTGEVYVVHSAYLLGADGGRTVGELAGIGMNGMTNLRHVVNVHLSADLSGYFDDSEVFIRWIFNPDYPEYLDYGCVLISVGPDEWGAKSDEWVAVLPYAFDDPDANDRDKVLARVEGAIGLPGLAPTVHKISKWVMEHQLADTFRAGRVFLLGDAAHRHPPTGGLGLNCAVHDAHNLCWKIAAVLGGRAGDGLLDTYDEERRPAAAATIDAAVSAATNMGSVVTALGLSPQRTAAENWASLRPLWTDQPDSDERRHRLTQAVATHSAEFHQLGIDYGYSYRSASIIEDGTPEPVRIDPVRIYQPGTRPGQPLPHAWVEHAGQRVAIGSLADNGHFVLIAGEDGLPWVDAARQLAAEWNLPIRAVRVGFGNVEYIDVRCAWLKNRAITSTGAVLVRPDRFVAWRALAAAADPKATLADALDQILNSPDATSGSR